MGVSNEKLFTFCESLRKMFSKLSFLTFALKFTNLFKMKLKITEPLYCADSLPTLYFTLGISNCNPLLHDGLFPNFKLKGRYKRVYYSLAVWRFKPILSAGLRFHSHFSSGLRLTNYRAVAGNHKFTCSSRFRFLRVFVAVIQTELRGS